jgi:hypothetical protein
MFNYSIIIEKSKKSYAGGIVTAIGTRYSREIEYFSLVTNPWEGSTWGKEHYSLLMM